MPDGGLLQTGGAAGGGGILGAVVAFFGLKSTISQVKDDVSDLKKNVVYKDTCQECNRGRGVELSLIREELSKMNIERNEARVEQSRHLEKIAVFMGRVEQHMSNIGKDGKTG